MPDNQTPDDEKPPKRSFWRRFGFLEIDAWIDSGLYALWVEALALIDDITIFMRRFRS